MTVFTPLLVVHNIQINIRTKIGIMLIMSLGIITACMSIGKVVAVKGMAKDMITAVYRLKIFSNLEQNLGIVCASAPALRQLWTHCSGQRQRNQKKTAGTSAAARGVSGNKHGPVTSDYEMGKGFGSEGSTANRDSTNNEKRPNNNINKRTSIEISSEAGTASDVEEDRKYHHGGAAGGGWDRIDDHDVEKSAAAVGSWERKCSPSENPSRHRRNREGSSVDELVDVKMEDDDDDAGSRHIGIAHWQPGDFARVQERGFAS